MPSPADSHTLSPEDLRAAVPPVAGEGLCPGLEAPLTVYRDAHGIPHLRASSEHDAWFGQGFVTAQDRLWQMEYDRRRAAGRWAEVVGREALEGDLQMRRFRIPRYMAAVLPGLAPTTRAMLEAYAAGVNAFIEDSQKRGRPLGIEFGLTGIEPEPWRAEDSLAVFCVRHILMGVWEAKVWRVRLAQALGPEGAAAFYPGYEPGQVVMAPPGGRYGGALLNAAQTLAEGLSHLTFLKHGTEDGSNNWVVGGAHTASGKPLLAGDPHRALDVPNVYYQNHVACGEFDVIGFSFPGVPGFPHFAHNARVAWGITHGNADYQDLFIERFERTPAAGQPPRYRFQGQWLTAEHASETVAVRGESPVTIDTWATRHGPVIAGGPAARPENGAGNPSAGAKDATGDSAAVPRDGAYSAALAFGYTALEAPNGTLDAMREMVFSQDADQLEAALESWVDPVNNLVYFDLDGDFGYRTRGTVPVRHAANAWLPVPGWSGEHEWRGRVPFGEMPNLRNPARGFAVTANNRITDEHYPHYIGHEYAPGFRAERIETRLAEAIAEGEATGEATGGGLDVAAMTAIQADVNSIPAEAFRPLYGGIQPRNETEARALELLKRWDCRVAGDSPGPAIFAALRKHLVLGLLRPRLGNSLMAALGAAPDRGANGLLTRTQARLHVMIASGDATLLPEGESWDAMLGNALSKAVEELTGSMGDDPAQWRWEREHHTAAAHLLSGLFPEAAALLDPPAISMDGDGDTVQAGGYVLTQDFRARFISVARYVFDGGDWERSVWIVPAGVSGHPGSAHYADQLPLYANHRTVPMHYGWERIAEAAREDGGGVMTLTPA
ncbi:MAG: penicillin acylase family protein [SAR324 cluster bacterium]|nr:penicillin acylase family protein [SAR324 cluster bacterium]